MTKSLPFTQAGILRRIEAARKAGLRVTGIAADGTVLVKDGNSGENETPAIVAPDPAPSKWRDVQ